MSNNDSRSNAPSPFALTDGDSAASPATPSAAPSPPAAPSPSAAPAPGPSAPANVQCAVCKQSIDAYFDVNGQNVCDRCRHVIVTHLGSPLGFGGYLRAAGLGAGAALLGSLAWYLVQEAGVHLSILAIGIAYFVGAAIRKGARARGGVLLQLTAVGLTYSAIACANIPLAFRALGQPDEPAAADSAPADKDAKGGVVGGVVGAPAADKSGDAKPAAKDKGEEFQMKDYPVLRLILATGLSFALPFMMVTESPLYLIIIIIGLVQAWRMNRAPKLVVSGPFRVGGAAAAA